MDDFCFTPQAKEEFLKKKYGLVGKHSAVQICSWTRKALRGQGTCYKDKFYGVDTYRCAQMSPCAAWCTENCIFCWRPMEWMGPGPIPAENAEGPAEIIKGAVEQRKRLLSGIGGTGSDRGKFDISFSEFPSHWAISLSGEPTLYPRLPELIRELKAHPEVKTIFLVSNGQEPEMLERLREEDALPTQLYISVAASNREKLKEVCRPVHADAWARLVRSLSLLRELPCRTVVRFTVIKGVNDLEGYIAEYAKLFSESGPDFIEVKAYMFLGYSRNRLERENMPEHEYVEELCERLLEGLPEYEKLDWCGASHIVLLGRKKARWPKRIL